MQKKNNVPVTTNQKIYPKQTARDDINWLVGKKHRKPSIFPWRSWDVPVFFSRENQSIEGRKCRNHRCSHEIWNCPVIVPFNHGDSVVFRINHRYSSWSSNPIQKGHLQGPIQQLNSSKGAPKSRARNHEQKSGDSPSFKSYESYVGCLLSVFSLSYLWGLFQNSVHFFLQHLLNKIRHKAGYTSATNLTPWTKGIQQTWPPE